MQLLGPPSGSEGRDDLPGVFDARAKFFDPFGIRKPSKRSLATVASVALASGVGVFGFPLGVLAEGTVLVDLVGGELALFVAADIARVSGVRLDGLAFCHG